VSLLGAGVAGCTTSADSPEPEPDSPSPRLEPDVLLLADAIADERAVLDYCREAARRHPGAARTFGVVRDIQQAHVRRLRAALSEPVRPRRPRRPPVVPAGAAAAVRRLAGLLAAAEEARLAGCLAAESGLLARLMASVSASHAVNLEHVRNRR
jgi:hypothetical protein